MEWTVGQSVVLVMNSNRHGHVSTEQTVTRVARKYAYYEQYGREQAFEKLTGALHYPCGSHSNGRVWASMEEYNAATRARLAYQALRERIGYDPNQGVTYDAIMQAAALLRIDIPKGSTP